jgi:hypothetical protein
VWFHLQKNGNNSKILWEKNNAKFKFYIQKKRSKVVAKMSWAKRLYLKTTAIKLKGICLVMKFY